MGPMAAIKTLKTTVSTLYQDTEDPLCTFLSTDFYFSFISIFDFVMSNLFAFILLGVFFFSFDLGIYRLIFFSKYKKF